MRPLSFRRVLGAVAIVGAIGVSPSAVAQDMDAPAVRTRVIVESLVDALEGNYVFPDVADEMAAHITERLEGGDYDELNEGDLAKALTVDLRSVSSDLHLRLIVSANTFARIVRRDAGEEMQPRENVERMVRTRNFGFSEVKILDGNIGYLKLDGFYWQPGLDEVAGGAMAFLANTNAIVLDLRTNGGGQPKSVQNLLSYFFPEKPGVQFNSIYNRPEDTTTEYWSLAELAGPRVDEKPLVVLTSRRTFSAAEAATYVLQTNKRATIVGETTGGGAHPTSGVNLVDNFVVVMPTSRAVNPITGTNWEGTGVTPDVLTDAARTYDIGYLRALGDALAHCEPWQRDDLSWTLDSKRAELDPLATEQKRLAALAGTYGSHELEFRDDALWYRDTENGEEWSELGAIAPDKFMAIGEDWFSLQFERGDDGTGSGVHVVYSWDEEAFAERDSQ
jgi:retinol-binding protein 3